MILCILAGGLALRLLQVLASWCMLLAWQWRDYLETAPENGWRSRPDRRQKLFQAFVWEHLVVWMTPATLVWQPFTLREKGTIVGIQLCSGLLTLCLLWPASLLGLGSQGWLGWPTRLARRLKGHVEKQLEGLVNSETTLTRQTLARMYRTADDVPASCLPLVQEAEGVD